jgi:N-methylhydantoinase A
MEAGFVANYKSLYGHAHDAEPAIVDTLRVSVFGALPQIRLADLPEESPDAWPHAAPVERQIYLGKPVTAKTYRLENLRRGMTLSGPAIIESSSTTIFVQEGFSVGLDRKGSLHLEGGR